MCFVRILFAHGESFGHHLMFENTMRNSKAAVDPTNFDWSLKPIIIFAGVLGMRINIHQYEHQGFKRLLMLILGFTLILINVTVNGTSFYLCLQSNLTNSKMSWTLFVYTTAEQICQLLFGVGVNLTFAVILLWTSYWKVIWSTLEEIHNEMNLSWQFHVKCRKHYCLIVITYVLVIKEFYDLFIYVNLFLR